MILAHPVTGYTITHLIKGKIKKLNPKQEKMIWGVGITSAILPDFDLALALLLNRKTHHHFITHTPIFYLVIGLIFASFLFLIEKNQKLNKFTYNIYAKLKTKIFHRNKPKKNNLSKEFTEEQILFTEQLIIIFLANTVIHILMDIPAGQLHPFWPIYNEAMSFISVPNTKNWFSNYLNSSAIYLELFWFIMGITLMIKNRNNKGQKSARLIASFWTLIAIISTIILIRYI